MNTALLGTGLMGQALAEHLLSKNVPLTLFNRSKEKMHSLQQAGAKTVDSAQDAVINNDFILIFLSDAAAINQVLDSIKPELFNRKTVIQMATISPNESIALSQRIHNAGGYYLESPVLGSLPEARTGRLILMVAGSDSTYQTCLPLLNIIGTAPNYIGDVGQAAAVKLAMNQLIAGLTSSFALSLALVEQQGIETDTFMKIVRESALYAPTFDKKVDRMISRNFDKPNFPTKHLAKDTQLFLSVAQAMGLETCGLKGIEQLIIKTLEQGLADTDYSALYAGVNPKQVD